MPGKRWCVAAKQALLMSALLASTPQRIRPTSYIQQICSGLSPLCGGFFQGQHVFSLLSTHTVSLVFLASSASALDFVRGDELVCKCDVFDSGVCTVFRPPRVEQHMPISLCCQPGGDPWRAVGFVVRTDFNARVPESSFTMRIL